MQIEHAQNALEYAKELRVFRACNTAATALRVRQRALNAVLHLSELSDQLDVTLASSKIVNSRLGRDDPNRCNQIKSMPFIHTFLAQSESARPQATTLYVYNMSLFLVACMLNRRQRASRVGCLQKKARGLTTPRSSKPPSPDIADVIVLPEIEVS
jgi:hypothetical protein